MAATGVYDLAAGVGGGDAALAIAEGRVVQRPAGYVYDLAAMDNDDQDLPPLPQPGASSRSGGPGSVQRPVEHAEHAYHMATSATGVHAVGQPATYDVAGSGDSGSDWNYITKPKAEWMARLAGMPAGSFVIRGSGKSFAALSFVRPDKSVGHRHIVATPDGLYKLAKSGSLHVHLDALVRHYAHPGQNDLPCPLLVAESDA